MRPINFRSTRVLIIIVFFFAGLAGVAYSQLQGLKYWLKDIELVDITAASLAVRDIGEGGPVMIIIPGMGCSMDGYLPMQKALAKHTRVISYDRPGLGYTLDNSDPKTLDYIDRDLTELVKVKQLPPPYILIGHSLGGHIIRYFAAKHLRLVAGLIFLDHPHEDWFNYIRSTWPVEESEPYMDFWSPENTTYVGARRSELLAYEKNNDLVRGIPIAPDIPVLMFTGNNVAHFRKSLPGKSIDQNAWADMQSSMLTGVKDATHVIDWETGHWPQKDKPELVHGKIFEFLKKIQGKLRSGDG